MNIKLFGYSISLNVLILIGILYLIMVVNALSGSCNREGLGKKRKNRDNSEAEKRDEALQSKLNAVVSTISRLPKPLSPTNKQALQEQLQQMMSMTSDQNLLSQINDVANKVSSM